MLSFLARKLSVSSEILQNKKECAPWSPWTPLTPWRGEGGISWGWNTRCYFETIVTRLKKRIHQFSKLTYVGLFSQGWRNGEGKIIELTNVETDDEGKVVWQEAKKYFVLSLLNTGLFDCVIVCYSGKLVLLDCRQSALHPPLSNQLSWLPGEFDLES